MAVRTEMPFGCLLILCSCLFFLSYACNQLDRDSLLFFSANFSRSPSAPLNWSSNIDCCLWEGIACNRNGWVTHLWLPSRGLVGAISPSLRNLTHLSHLNLSDNKLTGPLPVDFFSSLNLLSALDLSFNNLQGELPSWFSNSLTVLELYNNEFSGRLPHNIGNLSKLRILLLHNNYLSGTIPASLMNCTNLRKLNLGSNFLEGNISTLNFSKLHQLSVLDLGDNKFVGKFPISLYSCKSLTAIRMAYNQFERQQIQSEMLALQSLSFLSLPANRLTNISEAIRILKGFKNLNILILGKNFVEEAMPEDGHVVDPDGFQNLKLLALSICQLSGQIPTWLSKLKKLEVLDLSGNRFTGSIPVWLGTLPSLFSLNLADNLIEGEFPQELCKLPALTSEQGMAEADHTYIELSIYGLRNLTAPNIARDKQFSRLSNFPPIIDLSNNSLSGNIPVEIGQLRLLHGLRLGHNSFFGKIPDQLSNLCQLEWLDFSENHLSGEIPQSLSSLTFLSAFNVSYNNLRGPIPTGTQLQSFDTSAYEGNPELCGSPLLHQCQVIGNNEDGDVQNTNGHETSWFFVSTGSGFITGFFAVCCTLLLNNAWRNAYFQFLANIKDRLYVKLTVYFARMRRRLNGAPHTVVYPLGATTPPT